MLFGRPVHLALAVELIAAAFLLAGCSLGGSSSAPPTATAVPATATPSAVSATATPVATATPAGRTSLAAAYRSYEVGAYYFSGWSHGQNDNISQLLTGRMHASEPLIGWYDDSQSQVDKSIAQAANAGIDFFAFDWYDIARSPYATDRSLNEGLGFYLTSSLRHRLQFCLNFIDQAPFIPRARDWPGLIATWITYFKQPGYVHVDGKPLFIVFSPEHMRQIFGSSAGVHAALDQLRARARAAGLPGVTVAVAATVAPRANPYHVQQLNEEGYDAATGYNYHSMGNESYNVPVPYARLVAENVAMWSRVASRVHVPYFPVITSGWDQRFSAREQATAIIYAGRTPAAFACYAVRARHWIDTHPAWTLPQRLVLVFAWNEIGEGGSIIPNHRDGYAYADAVRTVFGDATHAPATPPGCSLGGVS